MKYIILIFLLAIVSCNDAEDDEIYINDFPHRISEPPLLDNKGDTAFYYYDSCGRMEIACCWDCCE